MSREKQIEERNKLIKLIFHTPVSSYDGLSKEELIADLVLHSGYRKQSEGKWKRAYNNYPQYVCTNCNHLFNNKSFKYCPHCGAKMKGGAE